MLWARDAGSVAVRELDWLQPAQLAGFAACDFVLATDCIYHEDLVQPLLRMVLHLCTPKTTGAAPPEPPESTLTLILVCHGVTRLTGALGSAATRLLARRAGLWCCTCAQPP